MIFKQSHYNVISVIKAFRQFNKVFSSGRQGQNGVVRPLFS